MRVEIMDSNVNSNTELAQKHEERPLKSTSFFTNNSLLTEFFKVKLHKGIDFPENKTIQI